jgi:heme/copper-type cytochrome/quinol oxidase subunit 2
MKLLQQFALGTILLLASLPVFAQGCSMCKTNAESAAAEQQKALNRGIVMLALPSVIIFGGLSIFAIRYRRNDSAERQTRGQKDESTLL